VHRIVAQLEEERLVQRADDEGRYALGVDFLRLAWSAASRPSLRDVALPHLRSLAAQSGETALLGLYDPGRRQVCIVAVAESDEPIRYVTDLYEWRDLHAGASGRAVLAYLPQAERAAILGAHHAALTEHTLVGREALERALAEVRDAGYALSVEERRIGGVGVAAPVFGPGRQVVASVGLALPAQRFQEGDAARLGALVAGAAGAVSAGIGAD
jgi:DNA-binding IclR family transcriptional regulator